MGEVPSLNVLRRMDAKDVAAVVEVHQASFPGFFLSFLGPRFLSIYYSGICEAPEGIGLVCVNPEGKTVGFVAGTTNPRGFYSRLLRRHWLKFSLASLGATLKKPSVVARIARGVTHPSRNPAGDDVAGLYSIGVLPEAQGTGAGTMLVRAFLAASRQRGCRRVFLTTDRDGNDSANVFYRKNGFHVERRFETPEGRAMNEYWVDLA